MRNREAVAVIVVTIAAQREKEVELTTVMEETQNAPVATTTVTFALPFRRMERALAEMTVVSSIHLPLNRRKRRRSSVAPFKRETAQEVNSVVMSMGRPRTRTRRKMSQ